MLLTQLIALINPVDVSNRKLEMQLSGIYQDSRKVNNESIFIAIRGTEADGHLFIEDAINRGASVIICEQSYYTNACNVCVIKVENSRSILGKIAQKFAGNPAEKLKIIGITGTNGKTTVATLVYQALSNLGKAASLLGTVSKRILNNEIPSVLTTSGPIELANDMKAMVEAGAEYLVMEVSSHALWQQRVAGFEFNVGAFTNLSHDHLDYHNTIENYAEAKKLLFDHLPSTSTAVINVDDTYGRYMIEHTNARIKELSFQSNQNKILEKSADGIRVVINENCIQSPLVGTFNAYNLGQAFLILQALGISSVDAAKSLELAKGAPGRMERIIVEGRNLPNVLVDYAHTPNALENVLSTLHQLRTENSNLYCVFGAGGNRDTSKRPKMGKVASSYADKIFVTSDNPRFEKPEVIISEIMEGIDNKEYVRVQPDRKIAIETAIEEARSEDIILIAGKGHENYQDICGTKQPFNDYEIAEVALQQKMEIY